MFGLDESSHFFYAVAIVVTSFVITLGFGHCDQETESFKRFKICMEKAHDMKNCDEPLPKDSPFVVK